MNNAEDFWDAIIKEYEKDSTISDKDIEIIGDLMLPHLICSELDKKVVGQFKAKQIVSIAVWNRLLARNNKYLNRNLDDYYFEKNNVMLIGNSGCGKTHLIKSLSEVVSLPLAIQDATTFTSAGYVGKDVQDCIKALFDSAEKLAKEQYDFDLLSVDLKEKLLYSLVEYGIIYIDEIDKIRASQDKSKDVGGKAVQEAFLKLIEGTDVKIRHKWYRGEINTANILFVFGGAFPELDKGILQRLNVSKVGFMRELDTVDRENILEHATTKDFIMYGMLPELIGRTPAIVALHELTKGMLVDVFTKVDKSLMSQIVNEFKSYGIAATFSECAVEYIIEETLKIKLGARGLRSVCQRLLRPLQFALPAANTNVINITKDMLIKLEENE